MTINSVPGGADDFPASHQVIKVGGYVDQYGEKWLRVFMGDRYAFAPLRKLIVEPTKFWQELYDRGLTVVDRRQRNMITSLAQNDGRQRPLATLDRYGWHHRVYLHMGRQVPKKVDGNSVVTAFPAGAPDWTAAGSMAGWQEGVRQLCRGQSLPTFAIACAFASILLKFVPAIVENPGFEFAGDSSIGKSTMVKLSASVFGHHKSWVKSWNTTVNGLEPTMLAANDSLLILDELNLFLDGNPRAGEVVANAIFKLAAGTEKARHGQGAPRSHQFVFLSTSNVPVSHLLSKSVQARIEAVEVRLKTIPVVGKLGCFDRLPNHCESAAQAIDEIAQLCESHYGWPGRAFVARLEEWMAAGPTTLSRRIFRRMEEFRSRANVNRNSGTDSRVVDKFALVYAAASLAARWKILPIDDVGPAILRVYESSRADHHRADVDVSIPSIPKAPIDRVLAYIQANRDAVIELADGPADLSDEQFASAACFLYTKWGHQWALFHTAALDRAFGNVTRGLLSDLADLGLLRRTSGLQTQIKIRRSTSKERVYCIQIARLEQAHTLPASSA
ncbi:DUF927 domain-containing protein [Mesorhizobium sp. M0924]|uniref:DUF927 domain-containing protein n=1 Tax=unclassified Mesorhizobium TaxID=325217 RepID=UPI0033393C36